MEGGRRVVRVQCGELERPAPAFDGDGGKAPEEGRPDSAAALLLDDEEPREMDARSPLPCRVVRVEERKPERPTFALGDQALERWPRRGHLVPQDLRRDLHDVLLLALIPGK